MVLAVEHSSTKATLMLTLLVVALLLLKEMEATHGNHRTATAVLICNMTQ